MAIERREVDVSIDGLESAFGQETGRSRAPTADSRRATTRMTSHGIPSAGPRPAVDPPAPGGGRAGDRPEADPMSRLRERVQPGGTIAVGVGSRGIHGIDVVARATVDALKEMGYRPFIVAAMGSHGGATAEGQRELLAGYGVTPEAMGVAGQDRHGHRRPRDQPGRPADLLRQERLRGRRHRPAQPGQAAHRLPRDATSRASSRCWSSAWASARGPARSTSSASGG